MSGFFLILYVFLISGAVLSLLQEEDPAWYSRVPEPVVETGVSVINYEWDFQHLSPFVKHLTRGYVIISVF